MEKIILALSAADNEATASPYWLILDPKQNMNCDIYCLAQQITGPFFNREDAENFLKKTRYNFSKRAEVFCMPGCYSDKYHNFYKDITKC